MGALLATGPLRSSIGTMINSHPRHGCLEYVARYDQAALLRVSFDPNPARLCPAGLGAPSCKLSKMMDSPEDPGGL